MVVVGSGSVPHSCMYQAMGTGIPSSSSSNFLLTTTTTFMHVTLFYAFRNQPLIPSEDDEGSPCLSSPLRICRPRKDGICNCSNAYLMHDASLHPCVKSDIGCIMHVTAICATAVHGLHISSFSCTYTYHSTQLRIFDTTRDPFSNDLETMIQRVNVWPFS